MKRTETQKVELGDRVFTIWKFSAFTSARIFGDLTGAVTPVVASVLPVLASAGLLSKDKDGKAVLNTDVDERQLSASLSAMAGNLSGEKLEKILIELLVAHENITYLNDKKDWCCLTEEDADEIFCGDLQDMLMLAWKVIRFNYGGFFGKFADQFGSQLKSAVQKKMETLVNTAN